MQQQRPNPDFNWSVAYTGEHRDRQFGSDNELYTSMDIGCEEKQKRQMAMLRNWTFMRRLSLYYYKSKESLAVCRAR
jgi:hypothetical protein